ncbi:type I restriction endonuclease subunit R [Mycoplasmopsis caviae]|uniref:Type I restriction enzyme endonuclease subunit n=1 Tax=Mycoplasmopsis caviae TaxID=55603 RepID=A0A3P8K8N7_9BACT|nr:type I restriction endonuclease subunit R [Mycoplasmopsis caviae]UUD35484.1 type I restriction endonuclease subunit R [Mycoplasmopsis caviae]VDR41739.1 Type I restriction enzyme EcoR124II R protein [Mycoplasmopsis caviae]
MEKLQLVMAHDDWTVVDEYKPKGEIRTEIQSEEELENELINKLVGNGYQRVFIHSPNELLSNLKEQIEKLNEYKFSNDEWKRFLCEYLINEKDTVADKTRKIQEDYIYSLQRDNGTVKNIKIIDKQNINNNFLQVINQYTPKDSNYKNRYDVTILVNGLPLVHIELKRRGRKLSEAFYQIERYKNESFWSDNGLYNYAQIFVISNGTQTKYYSNNTREQIHKDNKESKKTVKVINKNAFKFAMDWTTSKNEHIEQLLDFADTFLSKRTLLRILTKYCVFTVDKELFVMRPYQIVATERIINKINYGLQNNIKDRKEVSGYIWHSTGSGKTLTSFKTSQLAKELNGIDKVLFIVDRNDLDYQTLKEYEKFQSGSIASTVNTSDLANKLKSDDLKNKIVITTIQKMSIMINKFKAHEVYGKKVVLIFDECHRSQAGEMHRKIVQKFKNYFLFGFTGTPIWTERPFSAHKTTESLFGAELHRYTMFDAIKDKNVLPFKVSNADTIKLKNDDKLEQIKTDAKRVDEEEVLNSPERIEKNVTYILNNYSTLTRKNKTHSMKVISNVDELSKQKKSDIMSKGLIKAKRKILTKSGFNAMFATSNIDAAIKYYDEFKKQLCQPKGNKSHNYNNDNFKIAMIYSYTPNSPEFISKVSEKQLTQYETFDVDNTSTIGLDETQRESLERAIADYNNYFNTSYDSRDSFYNYYKDVSMRVKNMEIDLLIVVNMFLTGFDAPTLNTIFLDKFLFKHNLIQAFSRTNRVFNNNKPYGVVVTFRNINDVISEAVRMFSGSVENPNILIKTFNEYYEDGFRENGKEYMSYKTLVLNFIEKYKSDLSCESFFTTINEKKQYIRLYNEILKRKNLLKAFDEFQDEKTRIISDYQYQEYSGIYNKLKDEITEYTRTDRISIIDDVEFETDLIKVEAIDIEYILNKVYEWSQNQDTKKNKTDNSTQEKMEINQQKLFDNLKKDLLVHVNASPFLRKKSELIIKFLEKINAGDSYYTIVDSFYELGNQAVLSKIKEIAKKFDSKEEDLIDFMKKSFERNEISNEGVEFTKLLQTKGLFSKPNDVLKKSNELFENLKEIYLEYDEFQNDFTSLTKKK